MKEKALELALAHHKGETITGAATVIATAQLFEQYLRGGLDKVLDTAPTAAKTEVLASPAAKPIKEAKAPKATKVAAEPVKVEEPVQTKADAEEPTENTVDAEEVKGVIESLLKANKRKELIALFGKYKAKSFSSIAESDWAKFHNEASDILMSA